MNLLYNKDECFLNPKHVSRAEKKDSFESF